MFSNRTVSPILILASIVLLLADEWFKHDTGSRVLGFVWPSIFAYWGLLWIWQSRNISGLDAIGLEEIVKAAGAAIALGLLATLGASMQRDFAMLAAQVLAMLSIANLMVAATYVIAVGKRKQWWTDQQGMISWGVPLGAMAGWLMVAGLGALFSNNPVWLFQDTGRLLTALQWFALALVPFTLMVRAFKNFTANHIIGGKKG